MGVTWSNLSLSRWLSDLFPRKQYKLTMIGLDNAGKTTALYRLSLGQTVRTTPTVGSNVESVKVDNLMFEIWDLGGQSNLRSSWGMYLQGVDAVIVVLDSTDRARMGIAKQELDSILARSELAHVPLLFLANKQDLDGAMGVLELTQALALERVTTHDWHMQPCCALKGDGLLEGLGWISQRVHRHLKYGGIK